MDAKTNQAIIKLANANPVQKAVSSTIMGNGKPAKTAKLTTLPNTNL